MLSKMKYACRWHDACAVVLGADIKSIDKYRALLRVADTPLAYSVLNLLTLITENKLPGLPLSEDRVGAGGCSATMVIDIHCSILA
jgi:hypothetical protein